MKLFGSTKKKRDKTKNGENVPSTGVVKVVSIPFNSADNQYKQKSEVLYTFMPNKSYGYLLNVESCNLVFLKTYNTEFDKTVIQFPYKNSQLLEIRIKITLKLTFKNNAPFRSYLSKINNTFKDNAENLDVIMPMYNLLENSDNYSTKIAELLQRWNK